MMIIVYFHSISQNTAQFVVNSLSCRVFDMIFFSQFKSFTSSITHSGIGSTASAFHLEKRKSQIIQNNLPISFESQHKQRKSIFRNGGKKKSSNWHLFYCYCDECVCFRHTVCVHSHTHPQWLTVAKSKFEYIQFPRDAWCAHDERPSDAKKKPMFYNV